jgi:hypothetical protein
MALLTYNKNNNIRSGIITFAIQMGFIANNMSFQRANETIS